MQSTTYQVREAKQEHERAADSRDAPTAMGGPMVPCGGSTWGLEAILPDREEHGRLPAATLLGGELPD